jgi:leader peptidase (prepilin peptidase) / N-methyltransferase
MNPLLFSFESVVGLPDFVGFIFIFLLGAIIGSFLNVVIYRVPNEESIVFPNSACPKCKNPIQFYDNIPVLSWLILGGKCRKCKNPISIQYPSVELLTGIIYTLVAWQIGFTPYLPVCLIFVTAIIPLIFIDAEHQILPNVITYPLLVFALLVRIIFPIFFTAEYFTDIRFAPISFLQGYPLWFVSLAGAIFGGLLGGGSLWLVGEIWKRLRGLDEAMGLGDVKMMFAVGALLGWRLTFLTIFVGAFTGAIAGIFVMIKDKENGMQAKIPFGIFLGIGSIVALLFGDKIIEWYLVTFVPR